VPIDLTSTPALALTNALETSQISDVRAALDPAVAREGGAAHLVGGSVCRSADRAVDVARAVLLTVAAGLLARLWRPRHTGACSARGTSRERVACTSNRWPSRVNPHREESTTLNHFYGASPRLSHHRRQVLRRLACVGVVLVQGGYS
jgi:hypothetical protein